VIAGVVFYMILCWEGVMELVSLTFSSYPSPYSFS